MKAFAILHKDRIKFSLSISNLFKELYGNIEINKSTISEEVLNKIKLANQLDNTNKINDNMILKKFVMESLLI